MEYLNRAEPLTLTSRLRDEGQDGIYNSGIYTSENGENRSMASAIVRAMNSSDTLRVPSTAACEIARLSRDSRFDGVFFTAVLSTRIYCRPVCPARAPKAENVVYYPSAAAAQAEGFRPCLRCRPELAPGNPFWQQGEHLVSRGLKLINEGFLADHSLEQLAQRLHVSARQVRRLFVQHLGAPPMAVHATQRLLFAKQLLTETDLSITEVALASGFWKSLIHGKYLKLDESILATTQPQSINMATITSVRCMTVPLICRWQK